DLLTEKGRHHALLDAALTAVDELLSREETRKAIAAEVALNAPMLLRSLNQLLGLKLDERAALKIVEVAIAKIGEVRADRQHELRRRFDALVGGFIVRLRSDEALRSKVASVVNELVESRALAEYVAG